jgi:hypothetical protein
MEVIVADNDGRFAVVELRPGGGREDEDSANRRYDRPDSCSHFVSPMAMHSPLQYKGAP